MVSTVESDQVREIRRSLEDFGVPPPIIDLTLQRHPNDLERAIQYATNDYFTDAEAAKSVSGVPDFQRDDPQSSTTTADLIALDDPQVPLNPPPSPKASENLPAYTPNKAVAVKPEKVEAIDIDGMYPDDEDAIARAVEASLKDQQDPGMEEALAESLRSAAQQHHNEEPLHAPPSKRRRLNPQMPVILRSSQDYLGWLPPLLQSLYACGPFRNALLALALPDGELSDGLKGYWNGWLVLQRPEQPEPVIQAVHMMSALKRLFAIMLYTTRSAISTADIEHALGYDRPPSSYALSTAQRVKSCLHVITEAWMTTVEELYRTDIELGVEEAMAQKHLAQRQQVLHHQGTMYRPGISETQLEATSPDQNDRVAVLSLPMQPLAPDETPITSLTKSLDALFKRSDQDGVALISIPARTALFVVERPPTATLGHYERKSLEFPKEIYLDRYSLSQIERIIPRQRRERELEVERAAVGRKHAPLSDPANTATLATALEYLEQHATATDDAAIERRNLLRNRLRQAADLMAERRNFYEEQMKELDREYQAIFETEDMRTVGPYVLLSVFYAGTGRCHAYTLDHDVEKVYKLTSTDAFEVEPLALLEDQTGIYTNEGATFLCYARQDEAPLSASTPPSTLLRAIEQDNDAFAAELAADMDADLPLLAVDTAMPDLAPTHTEAGTARSLDESLPSVARIRGGTAMLESDGDSSDGETGEDGSDRQGLQLGFLQSMPRKKLDVAAMTGKVGGKPIWLDPTRPLPASRLRCGVCNVDRPMRFLLQINAPDDEKPSAYYRTLYVFACQSGTCVSREASKAVKVLRIQLPEISNCMKDEVRTAAARTLCAICGLAGNACSQCHNAFFCSSFCAKKAWPVHKEACQASAVGVHRPFVAPIQLQAAAAFFEHELVSEPEEGNTIDLSRSLPSVAPRLESDEGLDAAEPDTQTGVDAAFLHFQARLSAEPDQVLRYYFDRPPPEPLWISENGKRPLVPPCPSCGAPRTCELQILPTLISHLGIEDETSPDSFDFGTLFAYTCSERCDIPTSGWAEEHCHGQVASNEGMELSGWRLVSGSS